MDSPFIQKLIHNKLFLFIVPNLIYFSQLFFYYNVNGENFTEVLFYEVFIMGGVFFLINCLIYLFLRRVLKNEHKIFLIMSIISIFYFTQFSLVTFLLYIVFILVLVINFKKFITFKLDVGVIFVSFMVISLFSYNFFISVSNVLYITFNSKKYDYEFEHKVDDKKSEPNIYWIHCDGMTGINEMRKYFNYSNKYLIDYFDKNNYYYNEDASLVAGHNTQKALVAMFNPYYYDNFFEDYLKELEKSYLERNPRPSFIVDYSELEEKRLNNELFNALDKKNYTTVAISEFNPYTSFYTDYFYDYYYFGYDFRYIDSLKNDFRLLKDNSKTKMKSYIRFVHLKAFTYRTLFREIANNTNYLNYDIVDYKNFDTSSYKYIDNAMNKSNYWATKAILKGLNDSMNAGDKRFVFVNYKLNHNPFTFDRNGNIIDESYTHVANYYLGNYIYSTYLLVDMLEFIKKNDENAVIIVQSDHGLHSVDDEFMLDIFSKDMKDVQEIRNSVISAFYIPDKYKNGDEKYLDNPLNVSRYIVNNYVGENYKYLD